MFSAKIKAFGFSNITMNKIMHKLTFFGCIGFATALPVFGEPYSLLELPPQRSSKEAFLQYSRPLKEVDRKRWEKLRDLGYNEKFRVISFETICNGLGKKEKDFEKNAAMAETILADYIHSAPISFGFCDFDGKIYDIALPLNVIKSQKAALSACLKGFRGSKKQKQLVALYLLLLKDKTSLKLISGFEGGYAHITECDDEFRYAIHISNVLFAAPNFVLGVLTHEMKHALYYELGLSGEPALCSYETKFIRDVYQLPENASVPLSERTLPAIYAQCPAIAMDWHSIEEGWNMLGFIEIGDTVYINELCDCALPFDGKPDSNAECGKFSYHVPAFFMRSHIFDSKERWNAFLERQNCMVSKDYRICEWKDFDDKDSKNEKGSRYLEAISVALNVSPFENSKQALERSERHRDIMIARKSWYDEYLRLIQADDRK